MGDWLLLLGFFIIGPLAVVLVIYLASGGVRRNLREVRRLRRDVTHSLAVLSAAADREGAELAVYSTLLWNEFVKPGARVLVIHQETVSPGELWLRPPGTPAPGSEWVAFRWLRASADARQDFIERNGEPAMLSRTFNLGVPCHLLSDEEARELFRRDDDETGWRLFYQRYPGSGGTIRLSRIGLNARSDEAIVYVGNQQLSRMGNGYLVLLRRRDGVWRVRGQAPLWIS
jgi:hypothetical protein